MCVIDTQYIANIPNSEIINHIICNPIDISKYYIDGMNDNNTELLFLFIDECRSIIQRTHNNGVIIASLLDRIEYMILKFTVVPHQIITYHDDAINQFLISFFDDRYHDRFHPNILHREKTPLTSTLNQ